MAALLTAQPAALLGHCGGRPALERSHLRRVFCDAGGAPPWGCHPVRRDLSPGVSAILAGEIVRQPGALATAFGPRQCGGRPDHVPGGASASRAGDAILAKAQGNPFFLEELAQTLVEHGAAGGQTLPLPLTVQGVLAARLDRLPQEAKHLVQYAAVIGTDVPVPLLQAIAELPEAELQRALAHLQAAEFLAETRLVPERSYTFKHALTQEVVYESLLQERRCALHAGVVEALERLAPDRLADQVEQLAYHAVRGEVWDKALTYGRQAGVGPTTAPRSARP